MKRIILIAITLMLAGCAGGGKPITDFNDRSVVYAWLDVSEISGNNLFSASIRQYSPQSDEPYLGMAIKKHNGGYLIYHYGASPGSWELNIHFMGAYALKKERGGLFRIGEFSVHKISGPSKKAMLQVVLQGTPKGHPIVTQRIQSAMSFQ